MPDPRPEVMDFLLTRRSRPAKTLGDGGPDREGLMRLLTAAARSPDHGKLEPWRFVVIEGASRDRAAALAAERCAALDLDEAARAKTVSAFTQGAVIVAVISSPKPPDKIPLWEQHLSAGAVCLALLNAALASGWGANWLTGKMAYDSVFRRDVLGCREGESVAGFIHIGSETVTPQDRPRPDVATLTSWL
ncbi:MAG TPA: nitroreductase [Thermohalobaculum sp.]|nr:nitroreductase [Thermohalobaculum sp.]